VASVEYVFGLVELTFFKETTLEIEYKPSVLLDTARSEEVNDWISCLDVRNDAVWVSAMDGSISVIENGHLKQVAQDTKPIVAIKAVDNVVLSGGLNHQVKAWTRKGECTLIGLGHQDSITSIDAHSDQIVTGSFDSTVKMWSMNTKMRKISPLGTASGHTQPVTCVKISELNITSSSLDHSIRVWDLETLTDYKVMTNDKPIMSFDSLNDLLLSTHTDSYIRLWDSRSKEGSVVKLKFSGHVGWVSRVQWSRLDEHQFASCGYDGAIKLWDIRSNIPIYSLQASEDKLLALAWKEAQVVAGGQDKKIKFHNVK
jgi:ribosome biogenesis protein YTM1